MLFGGESWVSAALALEAGQQVLGQKGARGAELVWVFKAHGGLNHPASGAQLWVAKLPVTTASTEP